MKTAFLKRADMQLTAQAKVLSHFISMFTQHEDDLRYSSQWVLKEFPLLTKAQVSLVDSQGYILDSTLENYPEKLDPKGLIAYQGNTVAWTNRDANNNTILHASSPITVEYPNLKIVGLVDISSSLTNFDSTFQELENTLWLAGFISLLLGSLGAFLLASSFSKPIESIQETASQMAKGRLDVRAEPSSLLEVQDLSRTVNFMADQLDRRLAQLLSEQKKTQTLLATMPDPVFLLDPDNNVIYLNPAAESSIHIPRDILVGKYILDLWEDAKTKQVIHNILEGHRLVMQEVSLDNKVYNVYHIPHSNDEGIIVGGLLLFRDLTDIRRLEETRTSFLASVSHELRTPLTIIKGFSSTLIEDEDLPNFLNKPLNRIDQEADRLTRLVNEILDLTKIRSQKLSLELSPLDPSEIATDVVDLMSQQAQAREIALVREDQINTSSLILGDSDRIRQVLMNLIGNALKFTPPEGTVTVVTSIQNYEWVLEVKDTGPGISEQDLSELFTKFFRSKEVRHVTGTGLGLAIVAEIVSRHRGRVWAESTLGVGTSIFVALPLPEEFQT